MFKAVYEIGELKSKGKDESEMYITDIGEKYIHELTIILEKNGEELSFLNCDKREKANRKYLFREKKGNVAIPAALTLRDSGKGAAVIVDKFINFGRENDTPIASEVTRVLTEYKEEISQKLDEMIADIPKKEGKFYTVVITENSSELYPGDIEEFGDIFIQNMKKGSKGTEGICFLCGEKKEIGLKASDVFKFSSFDKPGFAYKMNKDNYFVNMPLCQECFSKLSLGKNILDNELSMNFYASRVYIVPRFYTLQDDKKTTILNKANQIKNISNLKDSVNTNENKYKSFEIKMTNELSKGTYSTLDFIFYNVNNQEMKINLSVKDVPPSRLNKISGIIKDTEKDLYDVFSTKEYEPSVHFSSIYEAFKDNRVKNFFDYVYAIFKGKKISLVPFKRATLDLIGAKKLRGDKYVTRAKQMMTAALFMDRLQNDTRGGELTMSKREERIEEFFGNYPNFFRTDEEKFLFIMGQIHSRIARFQNDKDVSGTIDLKLKAYNMRPMDFMNHFKDLKWKVTQYGKEMDPKKVKGPIMNLFQIANNYMLQAGFDWKASIEDLNYSFLAGEIATGVFKKEIDNETVTNNGDESIEENEKSISGGKNND